MIVLNRICLACLTLATAPAAHAGIVLQPEPDGVILAVGAPQLDDVAGRARFDLRLRFGSELIGRDLSFLGINVENTLIDRAPIAADSPLYFHFQFVPVSGSEIDAWFPSFQTFGAGSVWGLEEQMGIPGWDPLPLAVDEMLLGELVFDYRAAGLGDGQSFTIDLSGGVPSAVSGTTIGLHDSGDFAFFTPIFEPRQQTVILGAVAEVPPVPEPGSAVVLGMLAACMVWLGCPRKAGGGVHGRHGRHGKNSR